MKKMIIIIIIIIMKAIILDNMNKRKWNNNDWTNGGQCNGQWKALVKMKSNNSNIEIIQTMCNNVKNV